MGVGGYIRSSFWDPLHLGHAACGSREQSGRHGHVNEMKRLEMGWNDRGKAYIQRRQGAGTEPSDTPL